MQPEGAPPQQIPVKTLDLNLLHGSDSSGAAPESVTSQLPPGIALSPGTVLAAHYHIVRALRSGGMGAVYLASDSDQLGRTCAIKEMLENFASENEREEGQEWFRREAMMLASLQHQHIPQIYDYFIERGRYYLVMELIDGENLEDFLLRRGSPGLPEQMVLSLAGQICDVLRYLHGQTPPIIFRDLKPANVMLTAKGDIRLVDFGIARNFSAVRGKSLVGTPGYAPIEQYQGLGDAMSDLYSLGATMHHLLTGRNPCDAPPFSFRPVRAFVPNVSHATERLLAGILQKDSTRRGPHMEEFARQLHRIEADLALGVVPAVIDAFALQAPGGEMPPTLMSIPGGMVDFGRRTRGSLHSLSFPISNEGDAELRVVLRANVRWLHGPGGQVRIPMGTLVKVPLELDAADLKPGRHTARLELDGNGGVGSVPVEVEVTGWWWENGAVALMIASVTLVVVIALVARLVLAGG